MQNLNDGKGHVPFDSSVGRAEDCRSIMAVILRSLVQLRLEGGDLCLCLVTNERMSGQSSAGLWRSLIDLCPLKKDLPRYVMYMWTTSMLEDVAKERSF